MPLRLRLGTFIQPLHLLFPLLGSPFQAHNLTASPSHAFLPGLDYPRIYDPKGRLILFWVCLLLKFHVGRDFCLPIRDARHVVGAQ